MAAGPHQRTLQRALEVLGGVKERLAVALEVTPQDLEAWLLDAAATPRPDEASRARLAAIIAAVRQQQHR